METNNKIRKQRGAAMIEFALITLFVLIPLLFGIIEFSILLYDKAVITNASREGARAGIVFDTPRLNEADITNVVNNYCLDNLIPRGTVPDSIDAVPDACPDEASSGNSLEVTVNYHWDWIVLPSFVTSLIGPVNLSATAVMRCE